jgi:hypothetical protein
MPHYRLYFMNSANGHIERVEEFEAPDDVVAESALVGKLDDHALELWQGTRRVIRLSPNAVPGETIGDVIFSLVDGVVWASWPNVIGSVRVGPQESVEAMMRDFLDQCALGRRLTEGFSGE